MTRRKIGSLPLPGLRWRGLSLQLFVIAILPLTLLLLLIAFGGAAMHRQAMRNLVGERDSRATRAAASALAEQLNHRQSAVRNLALRAVDDPTPDGLAYILATSDFLIPDFDYGLAFFTLDGALLASNGDNDLWDQFSAGESPELFALLSGDNPQTFTVLTHPSSKESLVLVSATAGNGNPITMGAFTPAFLAHRALGGAFSTGTVAAALVLDSQYRVLYQSGPQYLEGNPRDHPGVQEALRGEIGTTYVSVDGGEHVIAFSPISPAGWALVVEEPWDAMASPMLRTTELAPLVLLPVVVLAVLALWFGARQIVQPLQTLEARAASLAWGDYPAIADPVGGIEEIQRLQNQLIHLGEKVRIAQQSLRDYIGAITTGQEEERWRLAHELHDDTLQSLIALNQRVQLARLALENPAIDDQRKIDALDEIHALTEQTIRDLRRITRALRPVYLEDLGLVAALEMLAQETGQNSGLPIQFRRHGVERRLPPAVELALFRMAQEGLSNVVRHAQASHASVTLSFEPDETTLTIVDDGYGFQVPASPAEFAPGGHFGLLGIHERADLIGARLVLQSSREEGTRLAIHLPQQGLADSP